MPEVAFAQISISEIFWDSALRPHWGGAQPLPRALTFDFTPTSYTGTPQNVVRNWCSSLKVTLTVPDKKLV